MTIPTFETRNTVEMTWQSSVAPDGAPTLVIRDGPASAIASLTMIQSDTTHFYFPFTMPDTPDSLLVAEVVAVATFQGSARNFVSRRQFKVIQTDPLD